MELAELKDEDYRRIAGVSESDWPQVRTWLEHCVFLEGPLLFTLVREAQLRPEGKVLRNSGIVVSPLHDVLGYRVAFLVNARLAICIDEFRKTHDAKAGQKQRIRDQVLIAANYQPIRFTPHQILTEPAAAAQKIIRLASGAPEPSTSSARAMSKRVRGQFWLGVLESWGGKSVVLYDRRWQPSCNSEVRLYRLETDMLLDLDKDDVRPRLRSLRADERHISGSVIRKYYECRHRQGLDPASLRRKREEREREAIMGDDDWCDLGDDAEEDSDNDLARESEREVEHYRDLQSSHWDVFGASDGLDPLDPMDAMDR